MGFVELREALHLRGAETAEATVEAARRTAERARAEAQLSFGTRRSEALAALELEMKHTVEAELIAARRRAKQRVLEARHRAVERVLSAAGARLSALTADERHRERLGREARAAFEYLAAGPATVRCPRSLTELLREAAGERRVEIEEDEALAGFTIGSSALTIDATLTARLEQLRPRLAVEVLRFLDGEAP